MYESFFSANGVNGVNDDGRQRQLEEEKGRVHCSRSRSRLVRSIVSEVLFSSNQPSLIFDYIY
jgi:hypothetical protein